MAGVPFFVKPIAPTSLTHANNQLTTNPVSNLFQFHFAGLTWKTSGSSGMTMSLDFGSAQTVDFVGMLAANAISATQYQIAMNSALMNGGGDLGVGSVDFRSGYQPFISPSVTTSNGLYNSHYEFSTPQTDRYFDMFLTGHSGDFEAAFLIVGKKIQPSRYYEPGWGKGIADQGSISLGRNGVPDIAPGSILRTLTFTLAWLTEDEHESYIQPLMESISNREPVYLCFDPSATTYRQKRTYFGRLDSKTGTKKNQNVWTRDFTITSII